MLERIKKEVPNSPGCYLYFNKNDEVIYIGKAKNLKKRMTSYFTKTHNLKTTKLVGEIKYFKIYITTTEQESLLLERNLIRENKPRYNIMLKDDKSYPYIAITKEKHPRIIKLRKRTKNAFFFGPYPSVYFVNNVISELNRILPLRKCVNIPNKECIYYHMKQCYAPCIRKLSHVEEKQVKEYGDDVKSLLGNNMSKLKTLLQNNMLEDVKNMDFEHACILRDTIKYIDEIKDKQAVELSEDRNLDVVSFYKQDGWLSIAIVQVERGLVYNITQSLISYYDDYSESLLYFLADYYEQKVPERILCTDKELQKLITEYFMVQGVNSHLLEYKKLEQISYENARDYFKNNIDKMLKILYHEKTTGYNELKVMTNDGLELIELYDISHLGGDAQVGVKVAYSNGIKNLKLYRKYKIIQAKASDEYGSMEEVLLRRFENLIKNRDTYPNLVILDGGKGQISSCMRVLDKLGLSDRIKVIGLVKNEKHATEAIINKNFEVFKLNKESQLYKFLYSMQEEVHRFAINYHRSAKRNSVFISELDAIQGLGPKRKKYIVEHFGSVDNFKKATEDEVETLKLPVSVKRNLHEFLDKSRI